MVSQAEFDRVGQDKTGVMSRAVSKAVLPKIHRHVMNYKWDEAGQVSTNWCVLSK